MTELGQRISKLVMEWPGVTHDVKWGNDQVFSVGSKMFLILPYESQAPWLSMKVNPDTGSELMASGLFIPAPYLARAGWIMTKHPEQLDFEMIQELISTSYSLVAKKLTRKLRDELNIP